MAKEIIINAKINTGNSANDVKNVEQELADLKKQLGGVSDASIQSNKSMVNLDATFEDIYGDLKPLSGRLGEIEDRMYELALAGQENTQEFKTLQKEVVKYRETIISVDAAVDGLAAKGSNINAALQLGEGVVQGYQGFLGVSTLLGNENERLIETLTKLQATQGVVNSLAAIRNSLDKDSVLVVKAKTIAQLAENKAQKAYAAVVGTSTKGLKAFRVALAATGIGALIVALGLLITNFEDITKWFKRMVDRFEFLQEAVKPLIWAFDAVKQGLQSLGIIDDEQTVKAKENAQARIDAAIKEREQIGSNYDFEIAKAQAAGKNTFEIEQEKRRAILETLKTQALAIKQQVKLTGEFTDEQKEAMQELVNLAKTTAQEITVAQITESKRRSDETVAFRKKTNDELKKIEEREKQETEEEEGIFLEQYREQQENVFAIDEEFDQKQRELLENEILAEQEANRRREEIAAEQKQYDQDVYQAKLALASMATSAILANMEEGSNAAKGIAAAQVVFDTYRGIQATFASAAQNPTSILFPAQPYIQAGIAAAFGFANVRKILAAQPAKASGGGFGGFGGGRTGTSSVSSISSSAAQNPINLFGNSFGGGDQLGQQRQSLKVEINANEITNTQKNIVNYSEMATL